MKLGVPTLCRYDLLDRLLASAEAGTEKPSGYIIIDNGGSYNEDSRRASGFGIASERIEVIRPGRNLGVAASWNRILRDQTEPVIIVNDDVELEADAFETLARAATESLFVIADGGPNANGWCLFAQSPGCTRRVGPYDEAFYPAYYEDSDYRRRMALAGIEPRVVPVRFRHAGWATLSAERDDGPIHQGVARSRDRYVAKWGGVPGHEVFTEPFNRAGPRPSLDLDAALVAHGSDKHRNRYTGVYHALLKGRRAEPLRLLEVGIGTLLPGVHSSMVGFGLDGYRPGGSLRAWRDYLGHAEIVGMDVQPDTQFVDDRIRTVLCDSTDGAAVAQTLRGSEPFDIIIDDGSHVPGAQIATLRNLWPYLRPGGTYLVEDIATGSPLLEKLWGEVQVIVGDTPEFVTADRNLLVLSKRPHGLTGPRSQTMPTMRWDVLNFIAEKIGARRYLEIGVNDGTCMRHVQVAEKWGVDPVPQTAGVHAASVFSAMASDAFFAQLSASIGKFDLVFIDGDHVADQAYRDVKNALTVLAPGGVIVLHDCNPHTEAMQRVPMSQGEWTGDVWKAIVRLRAEGEHTVRVVDSDYGVGVVIPHRKEAGIAADWRTLGWADLVARRAELVGLTGDGEWRGWLDSVLPADSLRMQGDRR